MKPDWKTVGGDDLQMSRRLIGIFPYIYVDKPLKFGDFIFNPIIINELGKKPRSSEDRQHLKNILSLFRDGLGHQIVAATYFISPKLIELDSLINEAQKAVILFRFSLLNSPYKSPSFEQTSFYLFEIPPIYDTISPEGKHSFDYRCLVNFQDDIYIHNNLPIFPPIPDLRTSIVNESDLDNIKQMLSYYGEPLGLTEHERDRFLISIEWYNQTFQKHPVRDERGKIVDIATAFEVLLDLPQENISGSFRACLESLLGSSPELNKWAKSFYDTRSQVVHRGKAKTLLYKHPEAATEHISLLASSRRIFTWCIYTILGDIRGSYYDDIINLFTSNEVYLKRLKRAGDFQKIEQNGLLEQISKLRPSYPVGHKKDITWLGKLLLRTYKSRFPKKSEMLKTLEPILQAKDDDTNLGTMYYEFQKEFEDIYFRYISIAEGESVRDQLKEMKPVPINNIEQLKLENAIYQFTRFASYALSVLRLK